MKNRRKDFEIYAFKVIYLSYVFFQFLKNILLSVDSSEMAEIVLPGVKLEHLKRAIQFMYT